MTDTPARKPDDAAGKPEKENLEAAAANATPDPAHLEIAGLKDKLLRTLADMENLRRRTEREVADARTYAVTAFARDILTVADNMQRAIGALDAGLRDNADPAIKSLLEGVDLTERELLNALEKHGVKKFDPAGQKFDPNVHQAMYEVPDPSVPAGMVAQVIQPGYMIGERVLRPALVGVSKGGVKAAPAEPGANNNPGQS
jgi:molecular chaperone GrpE